jgi:hypothetical protein
MGPGKLKHKDEYEVSLILKDNLSRIYKTYLRKDDVTDAQLLDVNRKDFFGTLLANTNTKWIYSETEYKHILIDNYVSSETGAHSYGNSVYVYTPKSATISYQQYKMA